jgi:hypothetical protein
MPAEASPSWIQQVDNVYLAPILHGRVEFSRALREAIRDLSPEVVALELPRGMEEIFTAAVARFPCLTFITGAELGGGEGLPLWRLEPTDPFCEAIRTARELEIPVSFVDDLEPAYPAGVDRLPDPYSITGLGPGKYYQTALELWRGGDASRDPRTTLDAEREKRMAFRLQKLARQGRVLLVAGMKHVASLSQLLQGPPLVLDDPPSRLPQLRIYHPSLRTIRTLADEMPLMITLYELQRGGPGHPEAWISPSPPAKPEPPEQKESSGFNRRSVFGALEQLLGMKVAPEVEKHLSNEQLKHLHAHLLSMNPETWVPPSFDGPEPPPPTAGPPQDFEGEGRFFTYRDANHRREELLGEYQRLNGECRAADGALDRQLGYRGLVQLAGKYYEENTGEQFKLWQHQNLLKFARRYATLQGRLLPGMLSLIFSARACVDHNFAYEVWDLATFYPWQEPLPANAASDVDGQPVSMFDFDGENLEIDGMRLRHFQLNRTFPRLRQRLVKVPGSDRATPTDDPNDWAGAFESGRICSYPPEDVVIEDYGRYLQKKAVKVQSEAHSRTEPFTTSLLDGIDMRTTLRNWADGQKIYVREEKRIDGGTGSVVLIFDQDLNHQKYPWCITWHGEHDQESDMAFYATDRRKKIIGPGIARCEYGGLMLSYPPRRLANVWGDPHYRMAKTKAEVLLLAAIDYCLDKHIVYVAAEAPRSYFFQLAQRLGRKLVYLPIGTLSPTSLERIRVFHVLAGHRFREIAKNFIW